MGEVACLAVLLSVAGCASTPRTVADAFPPARVATPWILQDEVWVGSFDEAAPALGDDADEWAKHQPIRVWLAKYCHEDKPEKCLTVRLFAFASADEARRAYETFAPLLAKPLKSGEEGCWTEIGVLFRMGRLVFDIFGDQASWGSEVESSFLAAVITKRLPPGVADDPK